MDTICNYWIGAISHAHVENMMKTIVVMTNIPIKKSELKKNFGKTSIELKKTSKKSELKYKYVIFQHSDLALFCQEDLKKSCILKTILNIYNKKNVEDEIRDKCCL